LSTRFPRPRARALGLAVATATLFGVVATGIAGADTPVPIPGPNALTVTVTTPNGTFTYPANNAAGTLTGPVITGAEDGQNVTITASLPGGYIARLEARQCKDVSVNNSNDFEPFIANKCSGGQLGTGSYVPGVGAYADSGPKAPGTTSVTLSFKLGEGVAPKVEDPFDASILRGFRCGPVDRCRLVVNVVVGSGGGSDNYLSFPLSFTPDALLECSGVSATALVSKGLTNTTKGQKLSTESSQTHGTPNCVGPLVGTSPTDGTGQPVGLNPVSIKLATPNKLPFGNPALQGASCVPGSLGSYPFSGKARITFQNLDSKGKNYTADAYLRLQPPSDAEMKAATGDPSVVAANYPDAAKVQGIVTKGAGLGADLTAVVLQQPRALSGALIPGGSSVDAGGFLAPKTPSGAAVTSCQAGSAMITGLVVSTDGDSLTSLATPSRPSVFSSLRIAFPT